MIRRLSLQILSVLLATAFVAVVAIGCGGGDDDGDGASAQSGDPIELLETAAAKPLRSALVDLRLAAEIPGFQILGEKISVTARGPIEWSGSGLPKADLEVMLRGGQDSFPARLTAVDDRVFVDFQGLVYEADPELVDMLPLDHAGGDGPTSLKGLGIDPSKWLEGAEVADGEEIGGDATRLITGSVDKRAVLADLTKALESPEVRDEIEQAPGVKGLPKLDAESLDELARQIGDVHVEVNVDEEGYARRVLGELDFTTPKSVEDPAFEGGTIGIELVIEKVGAKVRVQAPANPRPLSDLLNFAGVIFGVEKLSDLWTKLD